MKRVLFVLVLLSVGSCALAAEGGASPGYGVMVTDWFFSTVSNIKHGGNITRKKRAELLSRQRKFADLSQSSEYQPEIQKAVEFYGENVKNRKIPEALKDDLVGFICALESEGATISRPQQLALYDALLIADEHDCHLLQQMIQAFICQRIQKQYFAGKLARILALGDHPPFTPTTEAQLAEIFPYDARATFAPTDALPADFRAHLGIEDDNSGITARTISVACASDGGDGISVAGEEEDKTLSTVMSALGSVAGDANGLLRHRIEASTHPGTLVVLPNEGARYSACSTILSGMGEDHSATSNSVMSVLAAFQKYHATSELLAAHLQTALASFDPNANADDEEDLGTALATATADDDGGEDAGEDDDGGSGSGGGGESGEGGDDDNDDGDGEEGGNVKKRRRRKKHGDG